VVGVALALSGWWWHNLQATGQPFFNLSSYLVLGYSNRWPELSILRDFDLPPRAFPTAAFHGLFGVLGKTFAFLPHALKRALLVPSGGIGWLACIGLVAAYTRPRQKPLATAGALLALVPVAVMSLTVYDVRYLTPFLPFWTLGATRGAETLASFLPWWGRRPRTWLGLLLLLLLPALLPAIAEEARAARGLRERLATERTAVRARFGAGDPRRAGVYADSSDAAARLLYSDTPDFVAWATARPVMWLTREDWEALPKDSADRGHFTRPARGDTTSTWFHREGPR
jgi:hypothetical protein